MCSVPVALASHAGLAGARSWPRRPPPTLARLRTPRHTGGRAPGVTLLAAACGSHLATVPREETTHPPAIRPGTHWRVGRPGSAPGPSGRRFRLHRDRTLRAAVSDPRPWRAVRSAGFRSWADAPGALSCGSHPVPGPVSPWSGRPPSRTAGPVRHLQSTGLRPDHSATWLPRSSARPGPHAGDLRLLCHGHALSTPLHGSALWFLHRLFSHRLAPCA